MFVIVDYFLVNLLKIKILIRDCKKRFCKIPYSYVDKRASQELWLEFEPSLPFKINRLNVAICKNKTSTNTKLGYEKRSFLKFQFCSGF